MVRQFAWVLAGALVLTAHPVAAECVPQDKRPEQSAASRQPRLKFWQDAKLRQEIGITDQQSTAIEQIFSSSTPSISQARKELEALEAVLSRTIQENTADLITVSQQVDKVEGARSAYNKARTVMLYRINLVLSPSQRAKVKAVHERDEEQRRREERRKNEEGSKSGKNDRR